jgi:single-stranded DNA-specific DHH superfamily exonuclease
MIERLYELCEGAKDALLGDYVRVISHYDADGITAAGIICNALQRVGVGFHATLLGRLDENFVDNLISEDNTILFCDMGSSQPDLIDRLDDVVVLDHHRPRGKLDCVHVNPHLVGMDGSLEISASGVAYMVADRMGDNRDLAGLAIVGAIGDKEMMIGANKEILDEAVANGVISVKKGLNIGDGDIREILETTTDPYLDVSGEPEKIERFLREISVEGRLKDLDPSSLRRLSSAIVLKLMKRSPVDVINSIVGDVYVLHHEVIQNAIDFARLLDASGKLKNGGLALSLCLRDDTGLDEAHNLYVTLQKKLIVELKRVEGSIKDRKNIRYVYTIDGDVTSAFASTIIRFLYTDKPLIVISVGDELSKISGRGTKLQIKHGLDLSTAMRVAAEELGGVGGGHGIASGASVPVGCEDAFISTVDRIIGEQL